jgi:hypothetical protein
MKRRLLFACSAAVIAVVAHAEVPIAAGPSRAVSQLDAVNVALAARGVNYRVAKMDYVTAPGSGRFGTTVFSKDVGNRQLDARFVPDLLVYAASNPGTVSYAIDTAEGAANGGLTGADTSAAISRAMATWAGQTCAPIPMGQVAPLPPGLDLGVVQNILGFGGAPFYLADVTHAGWLPAAFFDAIETDGSQFIIGVTFTFIWEDADGNPVDTNGDHKIDAAFAETYYNNAFKWTNQAVDFTSPLVDVETIALHESGHALGQDHFGKISLDGKGTQILQQQNVLDVSHLHFAPRAVMNAIYWDTQRAPLGTDRAAHCAIWGTWGQ